MLKKKINDTILQSTLRKKNITYGTKNINLEIILKHQILVYIERKKFISLYVVGRSSKFGFRSCSTAQRAEVLKLCSYKQLQSGVVKGSGRMLGFHVSCNQTRAPRFAALTLEIRRVVIQFVCETYVISLVGLLISSKVRNEFSLYRTSN